MAAGAFVPYNVFLDQLGKEGHNLASDTLKAALFTSSYTPNAASDVTFSSLTGEHGTTNTGYTAGGVTLTDVTWTGNVLNATDAEWTAGSAGLEAKWLVVYNTSTGATNNLVAYMELEVGGTVSVTETNKLTSDFHDTDGIVKLSVPT